MIKPILDRILLKKIEEPEVVNGVVIPDKFKESNKYEIIDVGDFVVFGGQRFALSEFVRFGDIVLVDQYSVERVEVDEGVFWITRIQNVRGRERAAVRARSAS